MKKAPRQAASPMTGLSHVQLRVSNVARSADWYTAALGLEPYARDLDLGYVALRHRAAGVVIVLTARPGAGPGEGHDPGATGMPPPAPSESLDHLAFAVSDGDDLRAWADHLTAIGVDHPDVVLEDGNPSLQLRDPDGIAIELVAAGSPRPRG